MSDVLRDRWCSRYDTQAIKGELRAVKMAEASLTFCVPSLICWEKIKTRPRFAAPKIDMAVSNFNS